MLLRAAALRNMDLMDFVLQPALREAKKVIEEAERTTLSERDSLTVLKLLEKPPVPNAQLRKALASAEAKHLKQLPSFKNFRAIRSRTGI